jgi:endonuclease/exonuclease/phosphatase (EEP) superfamily protein YafD
LVGVATFTMSVALTFLSVLLLVGTLLPLSRSKAWWVRGGDFPRAQLAALSAVVMAGQLAAGPPGWWGDVMLTVAGLVACYQAWWIWPFTPLHRREVKSHPAGAPAQIVRVLTVNVLQSNRDSARLPAHVREFQPDLLLVLEANGWWNQQLAEFRRDLPHVLECPQENLYGMLLLSRWPLHDSRSMP